MEIEPPGGGIDYIPSEEGGLTFAVELLARLFSVVQTSLIGISLFFGMMGLVFYLYSQRQNERGLQFIEGGIVVFTAILCVPLLIETTSFLADGDPEIGTVQVSDEGYGAIIGSLEIVADDALDTDPNYPIESNAIEASLDPTVAMFGNVLSVLMVVVVSTAVIAGLFALILFVASPRSRKRYAINLLRGSVLVTLGASAFHLFFSALSWIAVGSPTTDRGIQPVELRGNGDASEYYGEIQLPHEAATPDVIYPVSPGDATVIPALRLTDRIAVLSEIGLAYLAVVLLAFGTVIYLTSVSSSQQKLKARQYIVVAGILLIVLAGMSMIVTAVGWVATGDVTPEQTIHQPGAPYADGTYFSSGSSEGWEAGSGEDLVPIEVGNETMALFIDDTDTITRSFEVADSPGNQVLVTVETEGEAIVTVEANDTTLVDRESVDGPAMWVSQTDAETLDIQIENTDDDTTLYIESVVVSPVLIEN